MKNLYGNLATYLASAILMAFGLVYLLRNSFMPYHSVAISLKWEEFDAAMQVLLLALMRATSGGFIAVAFAIAFLQFKFTVTKLPWLPIFVLTLGTISMLCSAYATLLVMFHTAAKPPFDVTIIGEIFLIIGFVFNRKYLLKAD